MAANVELLCSRGNSPKTASRLLTSFEQLKAGKTQVRELDRSGESAIDRQGADQDSTAILIASVWGLPVLARRAVRARLKPSRALAVGVVR